MQQNDGKNPDQTVSSEYHATYHPAMTTVVRKADISNLHSREARKQIPNKNLSMSAHQRLRLLLMYTVIAPYSLYE